MMTIDYSLMMTIDYECFDSGRNSREFKRHIQRCQLTVTASLATDRMIFGCNLQSKPTQGTVLAPSDLGFVQVTSVGVVILLI